MVKMNIVMKIGEMMMMMISAFIQMRSTREDILNHDQDLDLDVQRSIDTTLNSPPLHVDPGGAWAMM